MGLGEPVSARSCPCDDRGNFVLFMSNIYVLLAIATYWVERVNSLQGRSGGRAMGAGPCLGWNRPAKGKPPEPQRWDIQTPGRGSRGSWAPSTACLGSQTRGRCNRDQMELLAVLGPAGPELGTGSSAPSPCNSSLTWHQRLGGK